MTSYKVEMDCVSADDFDLFFYDEVFDASSDDNAKEKIREIAKKKLQNVQNINEAKWLHWFLFRSDGPFTIVKIDVGVERVYNGKIEWL